jgi:hypothetical protein
MLLLMFSSLVTNAQRFRPIWLAIAALLFLSLSGQPALATPAEVIIIRHGEKPSDKGAKHLSVAGEKRAKALVPFLKENGTLMQHGPPVALFATKKTKNGRGQRPGETLQPLAKSLKIPIQKPYESEDAGALAKLILSNPAYDGKTVLVCWTHEFIPSLVEALGVRPPPPKLHDYVYDRVYMITYDNGTAEMKQLTQGMSSQPATSK